MRFVFEICSGSYSLWQEKHVVIMAQSIFTPFPRQKWRCFCCEKKLNSTLLLQSSRGGISMSKDAATNRCLLFLPSSGKSIPLWFIMPGVLLIWLSSYSSTIHIHSFFYLRGLKRTILLLKKTASAVLLYHTIQDKANGVSTRHRPLALCIFSLRSSPPLKPPEYTAAALL